jgi:hypothetical protein
MRGFEVQEANLQLTLPKPKRCADRKVPQLGLRLVRQYGNWG